MALYKRGKTWWVDFVIHGKRVQRSAGTRLKREAREFEDRLKADLWREDQLGEVPEHTWEDAVVKYLQEEAHRGKATSDKEKMILRHFDPYLRGLPLSRVTRQVVDDALEPKVAEGRAPSTLNSYVAVVRQILNKAANEWEWLAKAPRLRTWTVDNERVRWLTVNEADHLLAVMSPYLQRAARFTLATGLRQSNVFHLAWPQVDLERRKAWVERRRMKTRKPLPVPLNDDAIAVLEECWREAPHERWVFLNSRATGSIDKLNDKDWKRMLRQAGVTDFRWHDLRHTWATWHVLSGTPLHELMMLGGWSTYEMVLRYAHMAAEHLAQAADRVSMQRLRELQEELEVIEVA